MMNDWKKSDSAIVPEKAANKGSSGPAEPLEGRAGPKGNAAGQSPRRAQKRGSGSQAASRMRQAAKRNPDERLAALLQHVTVDTLHDAFLSLRKDAADVRAGQSRRRHGAGRRHGRPSARQARPASGQRGRLVRLREARRRVPDRGASQEAGTGKRDAQAAAFRLKLKPMGRRHRRAPCRILFGGREADRGRGRRYRERGEPRMAALRGLPLDLLRLRKHAAGAEGMAGRGGGDGGRARREGVAP